MKSYIKKILILIVLGIIFALLPNSILNFSHEQKTDLKNPKSTGYWEIGPIYIDDDDPSQDWEYTASNNDWCSGQGTWQEPYIIENVIIDGTGETRCISIVHSKVYFIIKNCTLKNCYKGLYLGSNTSNGQLLNNKCFDNDWGIELRSGCTNNSVIGNNLNNGLGGIIVDSYSDNNTIIGNIINNFIPSPGLGTGISLDFSSDNIITENTISNCGYYGIAIDSFCNNNNISGNTMINCGLGFYDYDDIRNNIIDTTNTVNGGPLYYYVNRTGLGSSNFLGAGQIILINCNNSVIINQNIYNASKGLSLFFCNGNTISNNQLQFNSREGICLIECHHNTISGNIISNNQFYGIYLEESNYNNFTDNIVNNSGRYGIFSYGDCDCNNSILARNNVSNTIHYDGIQISGFNNTISENIAYNNKDCGLSISGYNNRILRNVVYDNDYGISCSSDGSYISDNIAIDNNDVGIIDKSENSMYSDNTLNNNGDSGIVLRVSYNCTICNNKIINNGKNGIKASAYSSSKYISNNTISGNVININEIGINFEEQCNNNTIKQNIIHNNTKYGIQILTTCDQNIIYNNSFNNPAGENAKGNGNNNWSYGNIGNYWHDYDGYDCNGDGIGETPYIYGLVIDNYPLCNRIDTFKPIITIVEPIENAIFGEIPPNFTLTIEEYLIDSVWYSLDNGLTNYTFTGLTGSIDQTLWNSLSDDKYTIIFYAKDVAGNIGSNQVTIIKDTEVSRISFGNCYIFLALIGIIGLVVHFKRCKKL